MAENLGTYLTPEERGRGPQSSAYPVAEKPSKGVNQYKTKVYDDAVLRQARGIGTTSGSNLGANLSYPEKRDEVYNARIKFTVFKAEPLDVDFAKVLDFEVFDNVKSLISKVSGKAKTDDTVQFDESELPGDAYDDDFRTDEDLDQDAQQDIAAAQVKNEQYNQEANAAAQKIVKGVSYKRDKSEDSVSMFVPLSVTFNDGALYDDNASLGVVGAGAMSAMNEGGGFLGSALAGLGEGAASIFGLADNSRFKEEAARMGAIRAAANPLTPQGVKNAVSIAVQRTLNPNTRPLFRGVQIRTFTFAFKMIATSRSEARTVERIVKHFRKNVYPEQIPSDTELSLAYKFPKVFDIKFDYSGGQLGIPKLERCYLRQVQTTFNPSAATFHEDGRPTEIDMTLTFVERRTLSRQDVERKGM